LGGQTAEALCVSLRHLDLFSLGLNCATGPEFMTDPLRSLAALSETRLSCVPNAGLPNEDGKYDEGPQQMSEILGRFAEAGWLNFVGGCCGTTPAHVRAFVAAVAGKEPRHPRTNERALYSGIDLVESNEDNRPLLVGERTNVIGSRLFKRLIADDKFEEAAEIARRQQKAGAQILDVCLADPDREELQDIERFLERVVRMVKMPLMIDSTSAEVIERSLSYCQGKSIINSINLEDGEERFERVVPLALRYGAALVVGTIDEDPEQGMAVTRERKLAVAERSYELLVDRYGVRPEDIIWDPLTFPCATGDAQYVGSAVETIEGLRLIKRRFPQTRTILGVSNVSFGLPPAGREVLNAVFLYHCTKAGLDMAIVNSEKLERYASIPDEERKLAEDLLWNRGDDPIAAFAERYRDRKSAPRVPAEKLSLDERLGRYIIEGTKDGLVADLDLKLREAPPLDIINGPLMDGMAEVGRLFNNNELIVAEVLQSAEAMKASVNHLETFMDKNESSSKAKILLATVKGDVHDIGKNLVEIILSNNGYDVVNLGIKVPPEVLIAAVREHEPDVLGLSGLLVKSAQQMVVTGEDLRSAHVTLPLLVGGAALSARFTRGKIAPAYGAPTLYAKDAMEGLDLLERIRREGVESVVADQERAVAKSAPVGDRGRDRPAEGEARSGRVGDGLPIPRPPDRERHVVEFTDLDEVWHYVNPQMLYGKHLGFRGKAERALAAGDPQMLKLVDQMDAVRAECRAGAMQVRGVYRWFAAEGRGNELLLFADDASSDPITRWRFPRQRQADGLCISDFVLSPRAGRRDSVALFVTTAVGSVAKRAEAAKQAGEYVRSHGLQALALESAEAAAELLHKRLRSGWGIADPDSITAAQIFRADYRGKRYSFGYPACPDLEGQRALFALLQPEDAGVTLTEGDMMDPEASVSALVFHHPDAVYFAADAAGSSADA
jgi:5-methyltetrahydrofolate--homocysteine methyltransferase